MSGLELPAFIVGLSGLTAIFDKGFAIWRVLRDAQGFGQDIAEQLCILEMEYFRFEMWWTALQHLALAQKPRPQPSQSQPQPQHSRLQSALLTNIHQPIISAAEQILQLLQEIEDILRASNVLAVVEARSTTQPVASLSAEQQVTVTRSRKARLIADLAKKTSWFARVTHTASPWKTETDKKALQGKLNAIIYWNDALYGILPTSIRDSVLQLGISNYMLQIPGDLQSLSTGPSDRNARTRQNARLLLHRQRLYQTTTTEPERKALDSVLRSAKLDLGVFPNIQPNMANSQYSILEYAGSRVLVEWYQIPRKNRSKALAEQRLAQLVYLLGQDRGSPSLLAPECLGFVEYTHAQRFGLVSALPQSKSTTRVFPETLHNLITHAVPVSLSPIDKHPAPLPSMYALPSLNSRYKTAATLAQSLYTFMLSRWHHEQFNSLHIAFLVEKPQSRSSSGVSTSALAPLDISAPMIGGFAVSRPDSLNEPSVSTDLTDHEQLYLHPTLRMRVANANARPNTDMDTDMPRFQRAHEIYAFGLLLAEIGFWNSISRIAELGARKMQTHASVPTRSAKLTASTLSPAAFKDAVIYLCQTDLACWMGELFRDVTVYCLTIEESEKDEVDADALENLDAFYWDVVMRLLESPLVAP
ncbi:hypothetical protein BDW74DRAFT_119916 [Aspergillus multicolor]|uniref:uncharacterized protein n=1 Tax=Aspergillus multicolor TaxID=41759 RepID=UPI003CCD8DB4